MEGGLEVHCDDSALVQIMTPREVRALYLRKDELRSDTDPLCIASALRRHNWLPDSVYAEVGQMMHQDIDRDSVNEFLISHLPSSVNLHNFVRVLDECGYRNIATRMYLSYITGEVRNVYKSTSGQRPAVHKFFRNLKRMVHDAQFENPRLALRQLANRFVDRMQAERNPVQRQHLADKCIAVIGAEIDAIAITFDEHLYEHDVFAQMKHLVSETSNTSITDVVYFGRLANANSIVGNFNNSEDMLTEARARAYNTGPCLELVNMLYIEVYVKLWQFEKYPTQDIRDKLMMWGRIGLETLEGEDSDTKLLWRRMFILRMVFCLLGVGNRANMIDDCPIDDTCLHQAKDLLSDIDRNWYGIETRRKMFYYVAKARLCELHGHFDECIDYIKEARRLSAEGHFEELVFIIRYYEKVLPRVCLSYATQTESEQHPSRNFVILSSNVSGSSYTSDMLVCELRASDTEKEVILLQLTPDTPTSSERCNNVVGKDDLRGNLSPRVPYKLIACDRDQNFVLLKSMSTCEFYETERFHEHIECRSHADHDQTEHCNDFRGLLVVRTSSDGSLVSFHDPIPALSSIPSKETNTCFKSLQLLSKDQTELKDHLVLSDICVPSQNYVIICAEQRGSMYIRNNDNSDVPDNQDTADENKFLPLKIEQGQLSVPEGQMGEFNSFLSQILTNSPGFHDLHDSRPTKVLRVSDNIPEFQSLTVSATEGDDDSLTQLKQCVYRNNHEETKKVEFNTEILKMKSLFKETEINVQNVEDADLTELKSVCDLGTPNTQLNDGREMFRSLEDISDTRREINEESCSNELTNNSRHFLNIQLSEINPCDQLSVSERSSEDFNLIPRNALRELPRYFMVQFQDGLQPIPSPPLAERSPPSGCSQ